MFKNMSGNIPGGNFEFDGWEFSGREFSWHRFCFKLFIKKENTKHMKDIKIKFESTLHLLPLIGDQLLQTVDFVGAVGTRKWLIIALLLIDFTFLDHRIAVARNIPSLTMCPQKINFWVTIKRMFVLTSRTDWKSCSHDESYAVKRFRFPLRISSANTSKSTGNCGFGCIYWRNP